MEAFVLNYITHFTYIAIFVFLMLTVFGFPFPEDAVLLLSGVVASQGVTKVMPTFYVAYSGVLVGDLILYYIGRRYGMKIIGHRTFGKVLTKERLARIGKWFHKWGSSLIFFGRHLVGVRAQVFLCAGVFRLKARKVIIYDSLSALIGVPLMILLGYFCGKNFPALRRHVALGHWLLAGSVLLLILCIIGYGLYTKKKAANA
jgi:membrane protein DedA with SNARE-associated domain